MKAHRDLCPIHRVPMWYTPMDGTYACQRVECGVTTPVNEHGSFKADEDIVSAHHAAYWGEELKARLLNTPPSAFRTGLY